MLICRDDPATRTLLDRLLSRCGLHVYGLTTRSTAADGQEAMRLLEENEWLVLILDLMMPAVSGWDVIAWLAAHRERKPNTVIVVTAVESGH